MSTNEKIAREYYAKMQAACKPGGFVIMGLPEGCGTAKQEVLVAHQGESFDEAMVRHAKERKKKNFLRKLRQGR